MKRVIQRVMSSTYMQWAKKRSGSRYNLATSGLASYPLSGLPVAVEDLDPLSRGGDYGYPPLQQAVAAHAGVGVENAVMAWKGRRWRTCWRWLPFWSRATKCWWNIPPMNCCWPRSDICRPIFTAFRAALKPGLHSIRRRWSAPLRPARGWW